MQTVSVVVLLFAKAKELSGKKEDYLLVNSIIHYTTLLDEIIQQFSLEPIKNTLILAVNEEFVPEDGLLVLKEGDKVAVIPPLSGGLQTCLFVDCSPLPITYLNMGKFTSDKVKYYKMDYIKLVESKINVEEIMDIVKSSKCGAVSLFVGTTRDNCDGLKVARLVYEAYETMANKSMKKVCAEVRKKWPAVENIAIYHRLGEVEVLDASVVIAISSPHRKESLEAVSFAIDSLKASVPVWKKEEYVDSEMKAKWKENKECNWAK